MNTIDRAPDELRMVRILPDYTEMAEGSVLICCGRTKVICTASVQEGVPAFLRGKGKGWLTAEYAMLPGSTPQRKPRDGVKKDGRGVEIQRLIGRSLRAACDLARLGERTVYIDCDVIQADGGTRTASITGAFVALCIAVDRLMQQGELVDSPIIRQVAAVSAGVIDDVCTLDLEYAQDSRAQVDMNIVMTRDEKGNLGFVEVQGTGEGRCYTRAELDQLLALGEKGCLTLMNAQREALGSRSEVICKKPLLVLASNNFNALIKARALMDICGCATLADDSGLCVDQLGGRPGVHSARYCGVHGDDEANNQLLLKELADKPAPHRAHYGVALALCRPGREPIVVHGRCEGEIIDEYRGKGGFGYDPLFLSDDLGVTFAEAEPEAKNGVSHRARAIRKLIEALEAQA